MTNDLRGDEYIDSRDVIKRYEELKGELEEAFKGLGTEVKAESFDEWLEKVAGDNNYWMDEEATEYIALRGLIDQAEGYGDWTHGATLIREDKFEDYAQELAEDIGAIDSNAGWPLGCIDWEKAADELKIDYMEVEFGGDAYLMRC